MEASPLIEYYKLSGVKTSFQCYSNEKSGVFLIISGVGKVRSAVATAFALNYNHDGFIVNFGFCGCSPVQDTGILVIANKITDFDTKKSYYPDILFEHNMEEVELVCVPHVQKKPVGFIDMESSGFYQAAVSFVKSHETAVIKLTSDHGGKMPSDMSKGYDRLFNQLDNLKNYFKREDPTGIDFFEELKNVCRFTVTMVNNIKKLTKGYCLKNGTNALPNIKLYNPKDKNERQKLYNEICKALY
jgi:hypothetical protein